MKRIIILILTIAVLAGCDEFENSAEKSKITYLALITMEGESEVELACNATSYTDPGASASLEGEPIDMETVLTGKYFGGYYEGTTAADSAWVYDPDITVNGPDIYQYYYSAINGDGFPAVKLRNVTVPACNDNLTTGIAGMYESDVVRYADGVPAPGDTGPYSGVGPIIIRNLGGGVYQISDALGGWYEHGRAFGYTGAAPGATITVNNLAANDFTFSEAAIDQTFGDRAQIVDLVVDAVDGTLTFTTLWAGYEFEFVLTPIEEE